MNFSYYVNETLEARIWSIDENGTTALLFFQPLNPSGVAWKSKKAAEDWAKDLIAVMQVQVQQEEPAADTKSSVAAD